MRHSLRRVGLALALLALCIPGHLLAQGLTGQISGTVTDSGGGVMPGATVTITNAGTNATRETVTGPDGAFLFPDLLAGTYDITVTMQGFKTYEQKGIDLGATERVALRRSRSRSAACRKRSPSSEATLVQTTNAARSGLVDRDEDRGHRAQGARLRRLPQAPAGRRRHDQPRGARLGQHGRPVDQRPQRRLQLLLRRRHQQGHRLEQRQLRGAGARLDRRGARPDLELPGGVRPQLRRDDHRRHPQRLEGLPRQRGLSTSATTR